MSKKIDKDERLNDKIHDRQFNSTHVERLDEIFHIEGAFLLGSTKTNWRETASQTEYTGNMKALLEVLETV